MEYRKKPIVIEAFKWTGDTYQPGVPLWIGDAFREGLVEYVAEGIKINTLEGDMIASPGDYIIKGIKGEIYPCKQDIFEASYELVE